MSSRVVIELANISKKYTVSHQKPTLIGNLLHPARYEEFWALRNVNIKIKQGDKIGIIGPNGAGKSTLLKIIAGITKPTSGTVKTTGKIVALLDLEAGFHPDLSGEENIYLNGMLVGMTRSEISYKIQQIIKFADIGNFINVPFYTYSSGMKFRLAFAVAMASHCDILIIDEVFVVGDTKFQAKSLKILNSVQNKKNITTLICSHIPVSVWAFAQTYYKVDHGFVKYIKTKELKRENMSDMKLITGVYKLDELLSN